MQVRALAIGVGLVLGMGCAGDPVRLASDTNADIGTSEVVDEVDAAPDAQQDAAPEDETGDAEALDTDVESDRDADTVDDNDAEVADEVTPDVTGSTEPLDPDLVPCDHLEYWPFSIRSEDLALRVHYRVPADERDARRSLAVLEHSLRHQVDRLGFEAPLDDSGICGPDGDLDVFTWRGADYPYVDVVGEDDTTPWDDGYAYVVMDPWGEFGGDELAVTLAHELNHACQASYDWSESTFIYEATSTFVEDEVYDDSDSYQMLLFDFQAHPDWSLDRDDGYETWFMYGAMLYLRYLRDRFYGGDASFIADLWHGLRSPADDNEPDWLDSLDALLARQGRSFADTLIEFARWRWYVAGRDDGLHLEEAGAFPDDATPRVAANLDANGGSALVRPMMLGSTYIDVTGTLDGPASIIVTLETRVAAQEVHWVVQALPGAEPGTDGELLTMPAEVALLPDDDKRARTLVVTALPGLEHDVDPDTRTDARFEATVRVAPAVEER